MDKESYFERIAEYKLLAKHEVGQNFLVDPDVCQRIVALCEIKPGEKAIEIGCGAGSLSYFLNESEGSCDLIDIDEGLLAKLEEDFRGSDKVKPTYGNAVKWDYAPYDKIVGNLPYYITSLILEKVFLGASTCKKAVFMVQKEAAERILAPVGGKEYSPLNVLWRLLYEGKKAFNVGRSSFVPAPHVDSSVIVFSKKENVNPEDVRSAYSLASSLFLQRRKTILNNLKAYLHDEEKAKAALAKAGINEMDRPEKVAPEKYLGLFKAISE